MKNILFTTLIFCQVIGCFAQDKQFNFHKTNSKEPLSEEYKNLRDSLLPPESWKKVKFTSDCIEMLYYMRNFEDQAKRNANINWDRGYVRSIKWIKWNLCSTSDLFDKEIKKEIISDLKRLRKYRKPYTDDDLYTRLNRRIIEYYLNNKSWNY